MSGARKFGGAFSPGGGGADAPQPRRKAKGSGFSWRVLGLYLAPTLLLFPGIWGIMAADARLIAWALGGWAALIFAAWMTGEGVKAAEAYDARAVARAPALPRKVIGAVIMAASVTAIAFLGLKLGLFSIVYGLVVGGAHIMAFGVDPMRAKGEGVIPGQVERVADKICEAEAVVDEARAAGRNSAMTGFCAGSRIWLSRRRIFSGRLKPTRAILSARGAFFLSTWSACVMPR